MDKQFVFNWFKAVTFKIKNLKSVIRNHETGSKESLWEQHASSWHHVKHYEILLKQSIVFY